MFCLSFLSTTKVFFSFSPILISCFSAILIDFSYFSRDEVLTKNKYLEDEAKRKAEAVDNGEENLPQDAPVSSNEQSQPDDDIFYDSDAEQQEE